MAVGASKLAAFRAVQTGAKGGRFVTLSSGKRWYVPENYGVRQAAVARFTAPAKQPTASTPKTPTPLAAEPPKKAATESERAPEKPKAPAIAASDFNPRDNDVQRVKLYRTSEDADIGQGTSLAETTWAARHYLDNPGYGGSKIHRVIADVRGDQVLDLSDIQGDRIAKTLKMLGLSQDLHPNAQGLEEWLPQSSKALDAARRKGYLFAKVAESYPEDTTTWIYLGGEHHGDKTLVGKHLPKKANGEDWTPLGHDHPEDG